ATAIRQNAPVVLITDTVGLRMANERMVVHMALAISEINTVQQAFATLAIKTCSNIMTCQTRPQRNGVRGEIRFAFLLCLDIGQIECLWRFLLQANMAEVCIGCDRWS